MTKQPITQSEKRFLESLGPNFSYSPLENADYIFIKSSSDVGVERNFGRNGARFAPESFINHFKKLTLNPYFTNQSFFPIEVSDEKLERVDFDLAQKSESEKIAEILLSAKKNANIIHLGGGHDHIYPLLKAIAHTNSSIVVLNIDAHTDTRTDSQSHSGNPFRKFAEEYNGHFSLFQIGIQQFANSLSTLSPLGATSSEFLFLEEINDSAKWSSFFEKIKKCLSEDTYFVLSIDVDALDGSFAPGVSAVNGWGLNLDQLTSIHLETLKFNTKNRVLGLYEMNPVYDSLSMKTIRTMTNWLYQALQK